MDTIDNKFEVLRSLGSGAAGTVYLCRHKILDREVAVKVLSDTDDQRSVERFLVEARTLNALKHPGIVSVLAFGLVDGRRPYYAMEKVDGKPLSDVLKEGPLSPPRFKKIFLRVLEAVEYAHQQGVIHRDIKPSNILIETGTDRPLLIDFGLVKDINQGKNITVSNSLLGTPVYMSPEQCLGKPADQRSDIYSIGCTMYECATGKLPFDGSSYEVFLGHLHNAPSAMPAQLQSFLSKCLAKEPGQRFQSAKDAADQLEIIDLKDTSFDLVDCSTLEKSAPPPDRRTVIVAGILVAAVAMLLLGGSLIAFKRKKPAEPLIAQINDCLHGRHVTDYAKHLREVDDVELSPELVECVMVAAATEFKSGKPVEATPHLYWAMEKSIELSKSVDPAKLLPIQYQLFDTAAKYNLGDREVTALGEKLLKHSISIKDYHRASDIAEMLAGVYGMQQRPDEELRSLRVAADCEFKDENNSDLKSNRSLATYLTGHRHPDEAIDVLKRVVREDLSRLERGVPVDWAYQRVAINDLRRLGYDDKQFWLPQIKILERQQFKDEKNDCNRRLFCAELYDTIKERKLAEPFYWSVVTQARNSKEASPNLIFVAHLIYAKEYGTLKERSGLLDEAIAVATPDRLAHLVDYLPLLHDKTNDLRAHRRYDEGLKYVRAQRLWTKELANAEHSEERANELNNDACMFSCEEAAMLYEMGRIAEGDKVLKRMTEEYNSLNPAPPTPLEKILKFLANQREFVLKRQKQS